MRLRGPGAQENGAARACGKSATSVRKEVPRHCLANDPCCRKPRDRPIATTRLSASAQIFPPRSLPGFFMMFKSGFSVAVLVTTAVLCIGSGFNAVSQAAAASETKIAAVAADPSAGARASGPQVYLMRGFLNVFSYGMDSLAAELRGAGISATVGSYSE